MRRVTSLSVILLILVLAVPSTAGEKVDYDFINRLRAESFHRSQVMDTLQHLTDVIGPRLTGSPGMKAANEWTRDQLAEWGLENARLESWGEFGRGWSTSRSSAHLIAPRAMPLFILPQAWTPGTEGPVRGEVMKVSIESEEDFEQYEGKLEGKILMITEARENVPSDSPALTRLTREELDKWSIFTIPDGEPSAWRKGRVKRYKLREKVRDFYREQGAVALISISSRDNGIVRVGGAGSREIDKDPGVPGVQMMSEHFNYLSRMIDEEVTVEVEIDVDAQFHDDDLDGYNTIAEIPGTDLKHEVVMLGAHLDSWHAGAGANDNGAGSAVMMEAVRLLKALDVKPRRTIRIALWSGEEQGLHGSRRYVEKHFADRPEPTDPEQLALPKSLRDATWPLQLKPEHENFSAYFNMDNGTGRFRGIYTQENAAVVPIFKAWLEPFHDLEADTVTNINTGGTDHLAFDAVGLPGFQFIQDEMDYSSQTHHTNLDMLDHSRREDLIQASTIVASFVYHAAMRDEKLPREPLPRKPAE